MLHAVYKLCTNYVTVLYFRTGKNHRYKADYRNISAPNENQTSISLICSVLSVNFSVTNPQMNKIIVTCHIRHCSNSFFILILCCYSLVCTYMPFIFYS